MHDDVGIGQGTADVRVQLDPADVVDEPSWVQITSWQGDGLVVTPLAAVRLPTALG